MQLTEKELKEFPVGTKIILESGYYIKIDTHEGYCNWYRVR